mgnify:FL=1
MDSFDIYDDDFLFQVTNLKDMPSDFQVETTESQDCEVPVFEFEMSTPESGKWESELGSLIDDYKRPSNEELNTIMINLSVKDFNAQAKKFKLDAQTLKWLKKQRTKLRNRKAALKARCRKEEKVVMLEKKFEQLTAENLSQANLIKQLEKRIRQVENQRTSKSK